MVGDETPGCLKLISPPTAAARADVITLFIRNGDVLEGQVGTVVVSDPDGRGNATVATLSPGKSEVGSKSISSFQT